MKHFNINNPNFYMKYIPYSTFYNKILLEMFRNLFSVRVHEANEHS